MAVVEDDGCGGGRWLWWRMMAVEEDDGCGGG